MREFDTYLSNNDPGYEGCWGVYPHTNGSGWVYASNIDGRLFVFKFTVHPYAASAEFEATPKIGNAPLDASFASSGLDLDEWAWDFGDGGQSTLQNPTHTYTTPGVYDVSLAVSGFGVDTIAKPDYVVALAETLLVSDTGFDRNTQVAWEINLHNPVPVTEVKLPILLSDVPAMATFDSISYVGCRTSYFEQKQIIHNAPSIGQMVVQLRARLGGSSPDLAPGDGPIARVHLTIQNNATPGDSITLGTPVVGGHELTAITAGMSYQPASAGAYAVIGPPCDCSCHADPICDGSANIQDVISTIAVAFRNTSPTIDPACVHAGRSDANCSGDTDVLDVVLMIGVAFRNEDPSATLCDPCN
jgi:PKD repeat protein